MSSRALARVAATNILRNHFDTEASDAGLRSLDLESTGARSSASYDASAVARTDRALAREKINDKNTHERVRRTLKRLHPKHAEMLSLAYAVRLRTRDTEDSKKRKALPQHERNWRVRLAELYGSGGAIVLASPLAQELFLKHVRELRNSADASMPNVFDRLTPMFSHDEHIDVDLSGGELEESADSLLARAARKLVLSAESRDAISMAEHAVEGGIIAWLLDADAKLTARIEADARQQLNEALDAFADAHGITQETPAPRHRSSERTRTRILASHAEHGHEIGG